MHLLMDHIEKPGTHTALRRYDFIDALRGWAILGVVVFHVSQSYPLVSPVLRRYADQGQRGVQLFYLLSALTLMLSFQARKYVEQYPISNFFIRRFFRLAPLFYLAIVFFWWSWSVGGARPTFWAPNGIHAWQWIASILFSHGWHPESINAVVPGSWSLAVEWWAYLLMPFGFRFLTSWRRSVAAVLATLPFGMVLTFLVRRAYVGQFPPSQEYLVDAFGAFWLPSQLPVFCLGVLAYFLIIARGDSDRDRRRNGIIFIAAGIYLLSALPFLQENSHLPGTALYGTAFLSLTYGLYLFPTIFFVNRLTQFLGQISYSIYLTHSAVITTAHPLLNAVVGHFGRTWQFPAAFICLTVVSSAVSWGTYRLVETPGQSLGRLIISRRESRAGSGAS